MKDPQGRRLLAAEAVTRCVEDKLWHDYKTAEATQKILALDIEVNETKRKVALAAMRSRFDAFTCEFGGGRRAYVRTHIRK